MVLFVIDKILLTLSSEQGIDDIFINLIIITKFFTAFVYKSNKEMSSSFYFRIIYRISALIAVILRVKLVEN
jgi:hypothetical protein